MVEAFSSSKWGNCTLINYVYFTIKNILNAWLLSKSDASGRWSRGLSNPSITLHTPNAQSQFKKHSQELLLYFSQDFSAYFEWDIVLGTVEYKMSKVLILQP